MFSGMLMSSAMLWNYIAGGCKCLFQKHCADCCGGETPCCFCGNGQLTHHVTSLPFHCEAVCGAA